MGEAELIPASGLLVIHSDIFFYGDAATAALAEQIATDIQKHWNEPNAEIRIRNHSFRVVFNIKGFYEPGLRQETVWYNDNPRLNFFRVENFAHGNISFVDGLGSNTGYFKLENLLQTGTTAAHEYGHTLGLPHPEHLDLRGGQIPGIMYPRGTLTDPVFQYNPAAQAGTTGGTMDPVHRKVRIDDIQKLKLEKLSFSTNGCAQVGEFSSLYHEKHG